MRTSLSGKHAKGARLFTTLHTLMRHVRGHGRIGFRHQPGLHVASRRLGQPPLRWEQPRLPCPPSTRPHQWPLQTLAAARAAQRQRRVHQPPHWWGQRLCPQRRSLYVHIARWSECPKPRMRQWTLPHARWRMERLGCDEALSSTPKRGKLQLQGLKRLCRISPSTRPRHTAHFLPT